MFVDIFPVNDYLICEIVKGGLNHGPEKSRETQKSKDQPQAARTLSQTRSEGIRENSYEMQQM
jgi:hypothetical protein